LLHIAGGTTSAAYSAKATTGARTLPDAGRVMPQPSCACGQQRTSGPALAHLARQIEADAIPKDKARLLVIAYGQLLRAVEAEDHEHRRDEQLSDLERRYAELVEQRRASAS
jgi:hypothetical protein